jgi:hypothetical protein
LSFIFVMTLLLLIVLLWRAAVSCLYVACLLAAAFVPRREGVAYFRAPYETHGSAVDGYKANERMGAVGPYFVVVTAYRRY